MNSPIIHTQNLNKTYNVSVGAFKGTRPLYAVKGVNLSIKKGLVVGLVGESGCGKSTLANMMLGLEKATSGDILLNGQSIETVERSVFTRKVQPVFQDPYSSLNPRKSVESIISLPLRVQNVGSRKSRKTKVKGIMEIVGLSPRFYHSYPNQLSGGQRQRVAIARALVMRPEMVILDEPTSALDVSVQAQILNLLVDLRKNFGLTYMLISHNLVVVEHLATRVAVMYLGRIVEEAETEQIFKRPRHPYTKALLTSVLTPDPRLDLPKTHLGISYPNPIDLPSGCTFHPRCPKATKLCTKTSPEPLIENDRLVECHFPEPEM